MPIPSFVPIIAGGNDPFGGIAAQQAQWAGFSRGVEENNLARLAAAQAAQNDWLQRAAAARDAADRQNATLQFASDEAQRRDALRAQEIAASIKDASTQRAWASAENQRRLDEERRRTESMDSRDAAKIAFQREQLAAGVDTAGQYFAAQYPAAKRAYEESKAAVDALETEKVTLQNEQAALAAKPKTFFGRSSLTAEENQRLATIPQRLREIDLALKKTSPINSTFNAAEKAYEKLRDNAEANGFNIDDETGTITHQPTQKRWTFKTALAAAKAALPAAAPDTGKSWFTDTTQPVPQGLPATPDSVWPGFTAGTGTLPPPEPDAAAIAVSNPPLNVAPSRVWVRGPDGRLILKQ